jgi:translation initiation factor IF-1
MSDISSKDTISLDGVVDELLPGGKFRVILEGGQTIIAYLAGKLRINKIRIIGGDKVRVEFSPYDLTKGRVTYRY